mmetsp:Transcript_15135/g.23738  ORF Transcript_15135/g.23738 Transcript_15135/m.23738 type:complete len:318 (-) Transcript_15135:155-1108(-)
MDENELASLLALQEQINREEDELEARDSIGHRQAERPLRDVQLRYTNRMKTLFVGEGVENDPKLRLVHKDPHVYLVKRFLKKKELLHFDQIRRSCKFNQAKSYTEAPDGRRVYSEERTSRSIYLQKYGDNLTRAIERRACELVGLPVENVEPIQVVRYNPGDYYKLHHDAGCLQKDGSVVKHSYDSATRLVTFFVYLNTDLKGEGYTAFPRIRLRVQPKRGYAVLFCNIVQDGKLDERVVHTGQAPVGGFKKYGLNIWVTSRDFHEQALYPSKNALRLEDFKPNPVRNLEKEPGQERQHKHDKKRPKDKRPLKKKAT